MEEKIIGIEIRVLANLIGRHLNEISSHKFDCNLTGPQGLFLCYVYDHQDEEIFQKDLEVNFKALEFKDTLEKYIQEMEHTLTKNLEPEEINEFIRIIGKMKRNLE